MEKKSLMKVHGRNGWEWMRMDGWEWMGIF
jgi:hypothetical protein